MEKGCSANTRRRANNWETPLYFAARHNRGIVRILIEAGAGISPSDGRRRTPLHAAVAGNAEVVARLLVEKGTDINAVRRRRSKYTGPLCQDCAALGNVLQRELEAIAGPPYGVLR